MLEGGRDAWSLLAYIVIKTLNQKRIMLCIWVSTNWGVGETRQLQSHFVTPPVTEENLCVFFALLSLLVACTKKVTKSHFNAIRKRESREENLKKKKQPTLNKASKTQHNPRERLITFHVLKHIRGLNFSWTQVSSAPPQSWFPWKPQYWGCVTALEASHINRRWMNAL